LTALASCVPPSNARSDFVSVQAEAPKPTEGLEYTYIRKPAANPTDPKDLAHLWEVSGSQELSQEILDSDTVLSPEQVCHFQLWLQPFLSKHCLCASTAIDLVLLPCLARAHSPTVCICLLCSKTKLLCMQLPDTTPIMNPGELTGMARPAAAVSLLLPGSKLANFELAGSNSSRCCGCGPFTASSGAAERCHLLTARESKPANQLWMAGAERL